ncbi:hypothetical protein [Streptomyces acidiscabies]|uniref:hypothetical protein n=1 Tax=Streptomyces acidiscabies TaxID=42234 RepID=UPI00131B00AC|nr:hypothetical protein [Streptomyces acidiscabies]
MTPPAVGLRAAVCREAVDDAVHGVRDVQRPSCRARRQAVGRERGDPVRAAVPVAYVT